MKMNEEVEMNENIIRNKTVELVEGINGQSEKIDKKVCKKSECYKKSELCERNPDSSKIGIYVSTNMEWMNKGNISTSLMKRMMSVMINPLETNLKRWLRV